MNKKSENKMLDRSRFIKEIGLGFAASIFTKGSVSGLAVMTNSSDGDNTKANVKSQLEPKPNVLSVSRQKNH